jgi:hypothetical protein
VSQKFRQLSLKLLEGFARAIGERLHFVPSHKGDSTHLGKDGEMRGIL